MLKTFQYIVAYVSMIILDIFMLIIILNVLGFIDIKITPSSFILSLPFGYLYHKYKPMEFKELIKLMRDKLTKKE